MHSLPRAMPVQRTYSRAHKRQRLEDLSAEENKRRRVEDEAPLTRPKIKPFTSLKTWLKSSSPAPLDTDDACSDQAFFSDDSPRCSTPPSSPPVILSDADMPVSVQQQTTYAQDMLSELDGNAQKKLEPLQKARLPPLVQAQINLGSSLQKTCKDCGMTYVKSSPEDSRLHNKFHVRNLNGLDLGKPFRKFAEGRALWRGGGGGLILVVTGKDRVFERRKAMEVLEVVQTELGAVDIPESNLWSVSKSHYQAFLYLDGLKCVGLCLTKAIEGAYKVRSNGDGDNELVLDETKTDAVYGISRIWTSKGHRKHGVARMLLDRVLESCHEGMQLDKSKVAFSQPTSSGAELARRWYGQADGWLVYLD